MTPPRLAGIDLGSNTVRLLVVEVGDAGGWRVVDQDQRVTRLGEGLASSGRLGEAPMARTTVAIAEYVARAARAGARETRIIATSAVREAANGGDFVAALERATGARVDVVSGEDEARLTVRGIAAGLGRAAGSMLAFDIGGGSTEFTLARDGRVAAAVSLGLGVVPLAERYPFPGPVEGPRYRALEREVRERLAAELPPAIRRSGLADLVGTAGTVTTLAALDLGLAAYDAARVQGHRLARAAVVRLRDRLGALTVRERGDLPCLEPGRADLIVPGVA
ncbi:MAG: hypothetical protein ACREM3_23700, partial [Candidatus Rokuibacteriota bacterium]